MEDKEDFEVYMRTELAKTSGIMLEPIPAIQDLLAEQLEKLETARDEIHAMLIEQDTANI